VNRFTALVETKLPQVFLHDLLSLFDLMQDNIKTDKNKLIDKAMDKIRNKHGSEIITFATLAKKEKSGKVS
jgi:hypothetical protein